MEPRPVLSAYLTIWAVLAGHGRTVAQLWTAREFRFYRCLLHSGRAAHISRILPPHVLADQSKFRSGLSVTRASLRRNSINGTKNLAFVH